jgi:hypothetical protein
MTIFIFSVDILLAEDTYIYIYRLDLSFEILAIFYVYFPPARNVNYSHKLYPSEFLNTNQSTVSKM